MKKIAINTNDEKIERKISIKNTFVGRDEIINDFFNDYYIHTENCEDWNLSVTNYYGIPGIGKSKVLYKIYDLQRERGLKSIYYRFDNNISVLDNVVSLSCALSRDYNFKFALFDIAYVYYCKLCGKVIDEQNKTSLLDNPFMNAVLPFFEVSKYAPIAGILEAVKPFENKWFTSITESDLSFLKMSPDDIEDILIEYFINDLKNNLNKKAEPIVICLDNIIKVESDFCDWFLNDDGIICNLPYVVWAIASNEEIKDVNSEEKYIRNVRLNELDYDAVVQYLDDNKIKKEFATNVYEVSGGIPIYIEVLMKKILSSESNEVFDLSVKDKSQWIEDYYLKISDGKKKTLKLLSINNTWNQDELIDVLRRMKIDETEYEYILEQSYVQSFNGKIALHQVIKDIVHSNMSNTEYIDLLSKLSKVGLKSDEYYLMNYTQKLYAASDEKSLIKLMGYEYGVALSTNNSDKILALHRVTAEFLKYKKSFCLMSSYFFVGEMYKNVGLFKKMRETMAVACEMLPDVECPKDFDKTYYENLCIHALEQYAFSLQNDCELEKSIQIRQEIIDRTKRVSGSKSIETLNAQQNLYSSIVEKGICDDEIEGRLKHLIKMREKIILKDAYVVSKNEEFIVMAKQLLCRVYAERKNTDKIVFASAIKDLIDSAQVLPHNSMARNVVDMFFSKIAMDANYYDVDLLEDLMRRIESIYSKDSDILESINYRLAVAYGENGNPKEGARLLLDLYSNSFDRRGESSKDTLTYKKEYAICISQMGNHHKAIELLQECKDVYENVYGSDESDQYNNIIRSIDLEHSLLDESKIIN